MQSGNTPSHPSFPEIEAQLSYNPVRFLDHPARGKVGDTSPLATAEAMIHGMDDLETVRAWIEVEVELERGPDGKPRQNVIKWLNQRQAQLEADTETHADETVPDEDEADESTTDGTSEPTPTERTETDTTAESDELTLSATEASSEAPLAADGGTTLGETPTCPDCHTDLTREEIAGQVGYWCPQCRDFREPNATEAMAV